mgnify:FL=1
MQIGLPFAQYLWRIHMFKWLLEKYQEWQFERAFQKRKKEIMKVDPFIYEIPKTDDKKN